MANENTNNTSVEKRSQRPPTMSLGLTVLILVIAIGVFLVVNGPSSNASNRDMRDPTFSGTAILSGVDRQITSSAFRRADASAFMGGVKLDFRDATMEGNEATLEVSAVMGGIEIRVPRSWTVVNRVTPVMGGVSDQTHSTDDNKRLVIKGTVFLGGLDIKN